MAKRKKTKKMTGKIIAVVIAVFLVVVVGFGAFAAVRIMGDIRGADQAESGNTVEIEISAGDTVRTVASKLKAAGVIEYERIFAYFAGKNGVDTKLKAGVFQVRTGDGYDMIFEAMQKTVSDVVLQESVRLGFPEGYTVDQIIRKLVENGIGNEETYRQIIDTADFGYAYLPAAGTENRLEGYLYPDTYDFFLKEDEKSVLMRFLNNFNKKITENQVLEKAQEIGMSLEDTINLASIVQAEGMVSSELPLISSVFHNRMEIGMKLESDATLNYTFPEGEKKWYLTYADMKSDNPYNTYYYNGLPPTAIMNPGIEAILAAVSPADTKYFYFCGVGDGTHVFSETYAEHAKNVDKYINNK